MPRAPKNFKFTTRLKSIDGVFLNTAIYIPDVVLRDLPTGRLRTEGTMNGAPFSLAIQNKKDGRRYFAVSRRLREAAGVEEGQRVDVVFHLIDPDRVDIPEELEAVLAQDDEAMAIWKTFTPGLQRGLAHYVNSVKNVDSRIRRALELMQKAKTGQLHVQAAKREKGRNRADD